jgi:hypothetical protein
VRETQVEKMTEVNAKKMHADKQAGQETEVTENDLPGAPRAPSS